MQDLEVFERNIEIKLNGNETASYQKIRGIRSVYQLYICLTPKVFPCTFQLYTCMITACGTIFTYTFAMYLPSHALTVNIAYKSVKL